MLHDKDLISIQEVRDKVERAYAASQRYRTYSQQQVDAIVEAMGAAGRSHARRLAELAVEETGYGNAADKTVKNLLAADLLPNRLRGMRTIGVLRQIPEERISEIAVPVGVVAAVLPVTNPTSTAIYKAIISLKAGNAIVIAPHPHAYRCTCETAEVLYRAALEAGAPEDIIQWLSASTIEGTNALMRHERTGIILATGGHGIVRAAYSSGNPALGVGPGNTPVLIDRSADVRDAVEKTVVGKMFDYGTVCTSEQAIVAEEALREQIVAELKARRCFFCDEAQQQALAGVLVTPNGRINAKCVGQSPQKIASLAGFQVPPDTTAIIVQPRGVGREHPLSMEKLSPVLALYFPPDWKGCLDVCEALMRFGGLGHTCVIYATDEGRIREFALRMPAMRVLVNTPAPQGSTGVTTNLPPSMTLGCGAMAGNSTGDSVGPMHLLNIRRVAHAVRKPEEAFTVPLDGRVVEATGPVDRRAVAAAVDRFLASRGMTAAAPAPAPSPAPAATDAASLAAEVVDRFLARRGTVSAPAPACEPGGS